MPTPEKHALLSASSAHRWLKCTAAPRFEEQFPETTSEYAEEGRLAHAVCELKVNKKFNKQISTKDYHESMNNLKNNPLYNDEMDRTSDIYLERLMEYSMRYKDLPYVATEVLVDYSDYVPGGFGTCDCVMIGGDTLTIADYKHGKGVAVSAEENPQMRYYALGALKKYKPLFGETIKTVSMNIVQPRIADGIVSETIQTDELYKWGENNKPIAVKAFTGNGEFYPGEHCRFCRGKAQCKARAEVNIALEDFKDFLPRNKENSGFAANSVLTDEEIGDLLKRGEGLVAWYRDLEEYALNASLKGNTIAGWKVVAGRSNRTFTDHEAAIAAVIAAGYDESLVYDRKPKTLTEIENLMGKTEFKNRLSEYVIKPAGKPTLVPMNDKRPVYSPAAADFAGM